MIIAIIQPTKLSAVRDALQEAGMKYMTVGDALGYGRQRGQVASFRGNEYKVDLLRKVTLEIVVNEDDLETAINIIRDTALTGTEGQIGDGKLFVVPIAQVIDIATNRTGPDAL